MSDMIERVAMALYIAEVGSDAGWTSERFGEKGRNIFRFKAHAAIEAMREPTEAMVKAGYVADPLGYDADDSEISVLYSRIYEGMINAALKD